MLLGFIALLQGFRARLAAVLQCARRGLAGALDQPFDEAVRNAEDVYLNQLGPVAAIAALPSTQRPGTRR